MRYQPLPAKFHTANRAKLAEAIGPDAIAIIDTSDLIERAGDFTYPFRPDSNFYYLTGVDEPRAVLVLVPGHPNKGMREVLFLQETNDFIALWAGKMLNQDEGRERSGIKTVMWLSELDDVLARLTSKFKTIFLNAETSLEPGPLGPSARRAAELRARLPLHDLRSAADILGDQRTVKAPEEINQIRRAIDMTGAGLAKAWAALKPGVLEYQLDAELTAEYTRRGATGPAFSSIIASGPNTTIIHYATAERPVGKSELVLFDVGAEAGYYAADISRTVPSTGKFSERQRAIYEAVYRAQQEGIKLHKPGATILGIDEAMRKILIEELVKIGALTAEQAAGKEAEEHLRQYYPHISHHLGLGVHDTGSARLELKAGMVVTCEPGLYFQEEGIGVRLEDVVLITETGHEVLSANIPSAPDAIEQSIHGARNS
jgi:Xaa-Pro aminopeptidase